MTQLEIKHLGRRLPYGLKYQSQHIEGSRIHSVLGINKQFDRIDADCDYGWIYIKGAKPILRQLSDLTKPITQNGKDFIPSEVLSATDKLKTGHTWNYYAINSDNIKLLHFEIIEKLLEWHFVLDEPEGTWIDVNSLPENPYK